MGVEKLPKRIDLIGKRFCRWVVKEYAGSRFWWCLCDCGTYKKVDGKALREGKSKSCGCYKEDNKHNPYKDLTGKKFNRLTVLEYIHGGKYRCRCDCGNEIITKQSSITSGHTKSCGCYSKEVARRSGKNLIVSIVGQRFGKLTVLKYSHSVVYNSSSLTFWECLCDCGKVVIVARPHLVQNHTKSCGCSISQPQEELFKFISSKFKDTVKNDRKTLDGKEIDIYIPSLKIGIEYNGSAFHSINGVYSRKDKYYHRDKFLFARDNGVHLISVFDIDLITDSDGTYNKLLQILNKEIVYEYTDDEIITDNDWEFGADLIELGYEEICQVEPESYTYKGFTVYRAGKTVWRRG